MRAFNTLSSLAVMAAVVYISFVHSLELFRAYGFEGELAYLGVIAVELTFVSSMLNIVVCRLKQRPAGMPSYIGGLLGVSLVAWSNVSATAGYGLPGVVLGLFVPAALIVSESIMSYAVIRAARTDTKRAANEEERAARAEAATHNAQTETAHVTEHAATKPTPTQSPAPKAEETGGAKRAEAKQAPAQTIAQTPSRPVAQSEGEKAKGSAQSPTPIKAPTHAPTPDGAVLEIARKIAEREGRPPSRRRLAREAGVTEWAARQALEALRTG